MSLSSGTADGKGVDPNAVEAYDSGDEWDIGVGNLIIDLDADLEKDKLEMSSGKEGGGGMAAPPVATLVDNIKFISMGAATQAKESKAKSKRSKNSKESAKLGLEGAKKEIQGRGPGNPHSQNLNRTTQIKGADKFDKPPRTIPVMKKDKDGVSGKAKKEKMEEVTLGALGPEKESVAPILPAGAPCIVLFEDQQKPESAIAKQLGDMALDTFGLPVAMTMQEPDSGDCRNLKKAVGVKHLVTGGLWNSQSATPKADFISGFAVQQSLDFLSLTETWITPENTSTLAALSSAFSFSHASRPTGSFGNFLEELDILLSNFPENGPLLILLGDFNIQAEKSSDLLHLLSSFALLKPFFTRNCSTTNLSVTPLHVSDHFFIYHCL
uniref:Uncharacterized protein n=1 Tax=Gasterosteus aculeatus aculeatus TaxID=481459 RepID=A0AAQ4QEE4_GASAC